MWGSDPDCEEVYWRLLSEKRRIEHHDGETHAKIKNRSFVVKFAGKGICWNSLLVLNQHHCASLTSLVYLEWFFSCGLKQNTMSQPLEMLLLQSLYCRSRLFESLSIFLSHKVNQNPKYHYFRLFMSVPPHFGTAWSLANFIANAHSTWDILSIFSALKATDSPLTGISCF